MADRYTCVEIAFYPEFQNHWLRFGAPDRQVDLDRRRSLALFKPVRTFGYVRWSADEYGTQDWRITIVQTGGPRQVLNRLSGVRPGGTVLLSAQGKAKVKQALSAIDALDAAGFDPAEISAAYFRHLHNRITVRLPFHAYSEAQHHACHAAGRITS